MNPILISVIVVGVIGLIGGLGLSIASVLMEVKSDEKVAELRAILPGANCGACGYTGCDGYAEALAKGETKPGLCAPGGVEMNNELGKILGVSVKMAEPKAAVVLCDGTCDKVGNKMDYKGVETCKAANMLYAGTSDCNYGCLGFGDCQRACPYGAIKVHNGCAVVNADICTACSVCVRTCPKGIIQLLPIKKKATVACSNRDKGAIARKVCKSACIACGKCQRACEYGAVKVVNNLAVIDPEKCTACGACVEACPTHCIVF